MKAALTWCGASAERLTDPLPEEKRREEERGANLDNVSVSSCTFGSPSVSISVLFTLPPANEEQEVKFQMRFYISMSQFGLVVFPQCGT